MRYSIFEYSQEKLVSLGLDVIDALLLNWFANFFAGKMEKQIFKDINGSNKIYGWVKISKIMEDLPVIGISTEKGIRNRFDAFVEKGILERETLNTQKGKKSFYRTTSIYESLINTIPTETLQQEENQEEASQRNCSSFAEEIKTSEQENFSQRKKTTYAKTNEVSESSQRKKMTYAKKDITIPLENFPHRNCSSFAEGNSNTFAERNCSSLALNNSVISNSLNNDSSTTDKKAEADYLFSVVNNLFENKITFSKDLGEMLITSLSSSQIEPAEWENYLHWAFEHLKTRCKNQDTFPGYFYKSITESALIYKYSIHVKKQIEDKTNKTAEEIVCPICGTPHNKFISCTVCNNHYMDLEELSKTELNKLKQLYLMPPDLKSMYEKEITAIYEEYNFNFFEIVKNSDIKNQVDLLVKQVNQKYGLIDEDIV